MILGYLIILCLGFLLFFVMAKSASRIRLIVSISATFLLLVVFTLFIYLLFAGSTPGKKYTLEEWVNMTEGGHALRRTPDNNLSLNKL